MELVVTEKSMDTRPGGPTVKREPSPEGLGPNPEDDLSAVGAAPNLGPLAPLSSRLPRRAVGA